MSSINREGVYNSNKNKGEKRYSKKVFLYGSIGLTASVVDYIISKKLGISSLFKPLQEMNPHEMITGLSFGISSISALGGGIMYCVSSFFEEEEKKELGEKEGLLEKSLDN